MIPSFLLVVVLNVLISSGISEPIYGGDSVGKWHINNNKEEILNPNEFPFMVNIVISQPTENPMQQMVYSCGGNIIGSRSVLTAAHCLTDAIYEPKLTIIAGIVHLKLELELAQKIQVKYYQIHEMYVDANDLTSKLRQFSLNDIAILWTEKPFVFGPSVNVAVLPVGDSNPKTGWIIGWGETEYDVSSVMLLKGEMKVVKKSKCQDSHRREVITDGMLCVISENRDVSACLGDSGGPFVHDGIVYGISSFNSMIRTHSGKEYCDPRISNVYTRVGQYEMWIKNSVAKFARTENIIETLQFTSESKLTESNQDSRNKKPSFWQRFNSADRKDLISEVPIVSLV